MRLKVCKNLKLMLSFTMVSIILLNCAGCKNSAENEQASALEYLEERYPDDEFELISNYGGGVGIDGHTYIFSSKNYPNNKVHVASDGDTFRDTYLSIKYSEQSEKEIREAITAVIGEDYFLGLSNDSLYCLGDPDISFESYKKINNINFTVITNYSLDDNERDKFAEELKDELKNRNITTSYSTIFFDKGTEQYEQVKKMNSNKDYNFLRNADFYCVVSVGNDEDDLSIRWDENE